MQFLGAPCNSGKNKAISIHYELGGGGGYIKVPPGPSFGATNEQSLPAEKGSGVQ